jgi:glycosyltransferase involved in cell wall biosynthesis
LRILIDYRPALRQRTGVGEYIHELVLALVRSRQPGETIAVFSSSWKDRVDVASLAGTEVLDRRVPVRVLNAAWHRLKWPPAELLAGGAFDVVHSFHPLPIPARRAAQVVTVHDLDFLDHPERTRAEIRRDYPSLAPAAVRGADHVLVNSPHTARDVERRLRVDADRITIATPGAPSWGPRTNEPAGGYLLFFGTLEPRKNVGLLLDAYSALASSMPDAPPLVLAGGVPAEARELIARTTMPPLAGRVHIRGYVAPEDRRHVYEGAIALVMPSHTEGFGIPALEAMTLGVPVLAANRGALPELVGGAGELFEPATAPLIELLRHVMTNPERRRRLRAAGWARAREYSWDQSAGRAREAWEMAVWRRSRRRG